MYRVECVKIGTLVTGEIDCADFKAKLLLNKDKPAIINVNIGLSLSLARAQAHTDTYKADTQTSAQHGS